MKNLVGALIVIFMFSGLSYSISAQNIYQAAEQGDLKLVKKILKADADLINSKDEAGYSALHKAIYAGQVNVAEYLISKNADINISSNNGSTPLHGAATYKHEDCVKLLIKKGAEIDIQNQSGYTPLIGATSAGNTEIVKILISEGAAMNKQVYGGETALIIASMRNDIETVKLLLNKKCDTEIRDAYGRSALLLVSRETGNHEMAQILIEYGADINALDRFGATPIGLASWRGFRELVNLLLDKGAKIDLGESRIRAMTTFAANKGLGRLFYKLKEEGADLRVKNENGGSLLHSASEGGSSDICKLLIDQDFDIKTPDNYGWQPLHYAAKKGRTEIAELLIGKGADINAGTLAGYTPLNIAKEFDRKEIVNLLEKQDQANKPFQFIELQGKYLGQSPPGIIPEIFAPDIVSSNRFEHGTVCFSPDGLEAHWASSYFLGESGYTYGRILISKVENGKWTAPKMAKPKMAKFSDKGNDDIPFYSSDGKRLYFLTDRPENPGGERSGEKIWFLDKTSEGWSDPEKIDGGPNLMGLHWQYSVAANGNIYFGSGDQGGFGAGDIYFSKFVDGKYLPPENLGNIINSEFDEASPFISSDESYIIVTRMEHPDGMGDGDLWISFKDKNGKWIKPVDMPEPINTAGREMCPIVTKDGKYLFFNSLRAGGADNYWVSADIIKKMKNQVFK